MRYQVTVASVMVVASGVLLGCAAGAAATDAPAARLRYVALGDSYTIGTSVGEAERWPDQLVAALPDHARPDLVANLAVNGATSDDVISRQLPRLAGFQPGLVSVLVGVNDVVRGVPVGRYAANVDTILDTLLETLPADRILLVSIPDYTRTPRGGDFGDPAQQRTAIADFNAIAAGAAAARGIAFVDISEVADRAGADGSLVARDGLHPSGEQYRLWVERILAVVLDLIDG